MVATQLRARVQVVVIDPLGLHMRSAANFAALARSFRSDIRVMVGGNTVDGKSVLDLTTLAAECGTALDIEAQGPDAEEAVAALAGLIGAGLDEGRREAV
jgi:phosphocarrier protein HPr